MNGRTTWKTLCPRRAIGVAGITTLSVLMLATACGSDDDKDSGGAPSTAVESTVASPTTSATIEIADVHENFQYYGACGNETVKVEATTFYPVHRDDVRSIDKSQYPVEGPSARPGPSETTADAAGFARVAPPGPGDDLGTMVVYSDGMARFESKSGRVIWLTDEEQTYNWVC